MADATADGELRERLGRWVAAGLIDERQAARIEAAEAAWAGAGDRWDGAARDGQARPVGVPVAAPAGGQGPAPARSRAPLVAEALGYAGGLLAVIAGVIVVRRLWPGSPAWAELSFAAAAAAALGAGGALVPAGRDAAFARLRGALWLMSTAGLVAFAGLLAARIWHLSPLDTTIAVAATGSVYAIVLWLPGRAPLQHLAMFAGIAVLAGTATARLGPGLHSWGPGLAIWTLSALWAMAVARGHLRPATAGFIAAGAGLLAGAQVTMAAGAGHVLALVTVAALLAAGAALHRTELLVVGAAGILLVIPQTAGRYLPASISAPVAVFVAGLALVAIAVWVATRRRTHGNRPQGG